MSWKEFFLNIKSIEELSSKLEDNWELRGSGREEDEGASYLVKKSKQTVAQVHFKDDISTDNDINKKSIIDEDMENIDTASIQSFQCETKTITLLYEYHIVYRLSYGVPVICYNAYKPNGTLVRIDEAWSIFNGHYQPFNDATAVDAKSEYMRSVLTEMDHPVLYTPILTLHPCKTPELMATFSNSKNKVLTFLSTVGPAIHLNLDLRYGLL